MYVLICGKSGSGKSTLGNAILGSPGQFTVGHGLEQTTIKCEQKTEGMINVTELVGTGETNKGKVPDKDALRINRKYLHDNKDTKYDIVFFAIRSGRFDQADFESLRDCLKILPSGSFARLVIVFMGEVGWLERGNNKEKIHSLYPGTAKMEMTEVDFDSDREVSMHNLHYIMNRRPLAILSSTPSKARRTHRTCYICIGIILLLLLVIIIAVVASRKSSGTPLPAPISAPVPVPAPVPAPVSAFAHMPAPAPK